MSLKIGIAPNSWGVEDPKNPFNPPWIKVFDEAAEAGYKGVELGPFGYLPQDVEVLSKALLERELCIVAGTLYDDLVTPSNLESLLEKTRITCNLMSKVPRADKVYGQSYDTPYFVLIDQVNDLRGKFAGRPQDAPRLNNDRWKKMMEHIKIIGNLTWNEYGIRSVVHPHAGGNLEYGDEILRFMEDVPKEIAGLCLDTGHLYYAQDNPIDWIKKCKDRLDYLHFKDINLKVYEDSILRKRDFYDACNDGVMCPIGQGVIDYEEIKNVLDEINYRGWIMLEQERDPRDADGSLEDVKLSRNYLSKLGY